MNSVDFVRNAAGAPVATPPRAPSFDSTLAFLHDPYRYIGRTANALGTDVFEMRLALQRTICMRGVEAARLFYGESRFERSGAAPEPLRATLFGKGTVQSLDGTAHLLRKAYFVDQTSASKVTALVEMVQQEWRIATSGWRQKGSVSLYRALQPVLTRAVCRWAGVPLPDKDVARRNRQLVALFDAAAGGLLGHLRSRLARWQAECWLADWIRSIRRSGSPACHSPGATAGLAAAFLRTPDGALLPARVAAAELLNLLRPSVAVSVYLADVAHALHVHPHEAERLRGVGANHRLTRTFVQEVRRHYPFFPAVVARVRTPFEWQGLRFERGRRAVLDLYGTNHDPRAWAQPHSFLPDRFEGRDIDPHAFVPQGGGDVVRQHRCPGEDLAGRLMAMAVPMLLDELRFEALPAQALELDFARLPAIPHDGMLVRLPP